MANGGWHGTAEEWRRIEAPIKVLDSELERFAELNNLNIIRNYKDWPGRSMEWGDAVRCLIQIYLNDAESLGVNVWICASQDRNGSRYWRQQFLCKDEPAQQIASVIQDYLNNGKEKLEQWSSLPEELEFATKLASP